MPVNILYPLDYLPTPNAAQSRLIDKFVEALESALQVSSLAGLWKEDCPDGPEHADIAEYLKLGGYSSLNMAPMMRAPELTAMSNSPC